jgi:sialate O-acetylesterase
MEIDGAVWFRKDIEMPAGWSGKDLDLSLGAIDDFDSTYFNGVRVGATGGETAHYWETPRRYKVPAALVKTDRAVLAVRVWDHGGAGGFMGPADAMWVALSAGASTAASGTPAATPGDALRLDGDGRAAGQRPERPELAL